MYRKCQHDIIQGKQGNSQEVGNFLGGELVLGTWLVNGRYNGGGMNHTHSQYPLSKMRDACMPTVMCTPIRATSLCRLQPNKMLLTVNIL